MIFHTIQHLLSPVDLPSFSQFFTGSHLMVQAVVDCGALDSLVTCLEEFDPGVKEAASWTLGYVAGHSPELAQQVMHPTAIYMMSYSYTTQQGGVHAAPQSDIAMSHVTMPLDRSDCNHLPYARHASKDKLW